MKTVMFVGEGRAGKDTACDYLSQITFLRNAGTTSKYLCEYVAGKLGLPVEEAYRRRHESDAMRTVWYDAGNEIREKDVLTLVKMALKNGEITGGVRDLPEMIAARDSGLIDLVVWIENKRVKKDPTVKFTSREADIVIENNWGLDEFYRRIERFARFAGLPMRGERTVTHEPVYVVCHDNYGDQGVDFHGVFGDRSAAEAYVLSREPDEHERQWWEIYEEKVQ